MNASEPTATLSCPHCGQAMAPRPLLASVTLPIRTVTESNANENWRMKHKRAQSQIHTTKLILRASGGTPPPAPLYVVMTRIAPCKMDSDNLVSSCKHIRDAVAEWLGIDDGDDRVTYQVQAERGRPKQYAVRVEIYKGESR